MLQSLPMNNLSNCNDYLEIRRTSCTTYELKNVTTNPVTFSFTEQGGSFTITNTIEPEIVTTVTLPYDGIYEIYYTVSELDGEKLEFYDYIFENCTFIDCIDKLMIQYICTLPVEPCDIIEESNCGDDCTDTLSECQKQKQLNNLFQLYTFYLIKVFNFRLYWSGITNVTPATEKVAEIKFLLDRIKAFVATCNIDCDQKCNDCG